MKNMGPNSIALFFVRKNFFQKFISNLSCMLLAVQINKLGDKLGKVEEI